MRVARGTARVASEISLGAPAFSFVTSNITSFAADRSFRGPTAQNLQCRWGVVRYVDRAEMIFSSPYISALFESSLVSLFNAPRLHLSRFP